MLGPLIAQDLRSLHIPVPDPVHTACAVPSIQTRIRRLRNQAQVIDRGKRKQAVPALPPDNLDLAVLISHLLFEGRA